MMRFQLPVKNILILIFVSVLAYLPLINQLGYTHDDWYLMPSARAEGTSVFWSIFSVDRPLRALVMTPAYMLFGENPLYYGLSVYLFRVLGTLALLWTLYKLWPGKSNTALLMSILFLIYPGFLSQPNAIDYQSHIVGLAAILISIACTLQGIISENRLAKTIFHGLSILLGWLALGQMEWYIGAEFFRWACVFLLSSRQAGTLLQKVWHTIQQAYPAIAIPLCFLVWRLLFFKGQRSATDVNIQFGTLRLYPLQTIYHWVIQTFQDLLETLLYAWSVPLSQLRNYIQNWGWLLAIIVAGLVIFAIQLSEKVDSQNEPSQSDMYREALLLGLLAAIVGLIPIAMANRQVTFPIYSRYSLISSIGVAIFIAELLMNFKNIILRNSLVAGLCIIAVLTHHANSVKYAQETAVSNTFWWQVSWRVPQFEKNTTLIANYPAGVIEEDYFVWGPASLIYYPEKQNPKVIQPGLFAAVLNTDTITKVQARERQEYDSRKNIITYKNYRNIVILTQPTAISCVHVLNGNSPEYPQGEWDSIRAIGSYSKMDNIQVDETPHTPPTVVFGPEPSHGWCYYYEKADLARQKGDWNQVLKIGNQAFNKELLPTDPIEWLPFLQAYAQTGNVKRLTELAPAINTSSNISLQACQTISSMPGLSTEVTETTQTLYCIK
jgi:hypothetical protein